MQSFIIHGNSKNLGEKITDYFKKKLDECIEENGIGSLIVLNKSQELDMLVVREQLKKLPRTPASSPR